MSAEFVTAVIFGLFAVAAFMVLRKSTKEVKAFEAKVDEAKENQQSDSSYRRNYIGDFESKLAAAKGFQFISKVMFRVLLGVTVLLVIFSMLYIVPIRNVGIVTTFQNPTGTTTGSGLKIVLPWQEIQDFDASVQNSDHTGGEHCTTVRIGSLATACVENRIQWQVVESAAPKLFRDYKGSFDNLKNNFVETYIQNALNKVFSTYNPLSQVNISTGQTEFDGAKLGQNVKAELESTIGTDVKILTVSVPLVHHDAKTEENIKQFQDVIAQARILEQKNKNADLEKQIADKQRVFLTPEYIQNKCIEESVKMGVPPGYCMMNGAIVNAPPAK